MTREMKLSLNATKYMKKHVNTGFECVFFPPHRIAEAGLDDSGGHTVHSYVALSQLGSQRPGQTQQCCLTHTVRT